MTFRIGSRVVADNFHGIGIVVQLRTLRGEARVIWPSGMRAWHLAEDLRAAEPQQGAGAPQSAPAGVAK